MTSLSACIVVLCSQTGKHVLTSYQEGWLKELPLWLCTVHILHYGCKLRASAHTHTHTHTHTLTLTHTHTHTHTLTHTHSHTHTHSLTHTHSHSHTLTYTHIRTLTHTHTHSHLHACAPHTLWWRAAVLDCKVAVVGDRAGFSVVVL